MKKKIIPSPEMFRLLIDQNIFGIAIIQNDKLVFINRKGLEITEFSATQLENMALNIFSCLIHPDDVEYVKAQSKKKQGEDDTPGIRKNYVYRIITGSGTTKWIKLFSDSITYKKKPAVMGVFTDITDSKNRESELISNSEKIRNALDESENRCKVINELIVSFAYCLHIHEDQSFSTEWIAGSFFELTGYTVEEVKEIGGWKALVYQEDRECVEKQIQTLLRGEEVTIEYRIVTCSGSIRWVKDYAMVKEDRSGLNKKKCYGAVKDITEQKRIENEYLHMQKQESLGLFAGGIAHDFNNILTTILGGASLAKFKLDDDNSINKILNDIEKASLQARELTNKLLVYSKGSVPLKKYYDIRNIIFDTVNFVLSGSNIIPRYHFPGKMRPVRIDKGQISQVIQNLVLNSMQSMSSGGQLDISLEEEELLKGEHQLEKGTYIKIVIKDYGCGIAEEIKSKVFDPYFTTKEEGHGIGLSACRSIIQAHRGHIGFTSECKCGTEFCVYLPGVEKKGAGDVEKNALPVIDSLKKRILVVDDKDNINHVARNMLGNMGITVFTANKSDEALGMYRRFYNSQTPFDIVLLDLIFPGDCSGVEILEKMRCIDPGVKAIVMSGCTKNPVLEKFDKFGFSGVICKPFTFYELYNAITLLNKENP